MSGLKILPNWHDTCIMVIIDRKIFNFRLKYTETKKDIDGKFFVLPQNQPLQIDYTQFYACLQMHRQNYTWEIHIYKVSIKAKWYMKATINHLGHMYLESGERLFAHWRHWALHKYDVCDSYQNLLKPLIGNKTFWVVIRGIIMRSTISSCSLCRETEQLDCQ